MIFIKRIEKETPSGYAPKYLIRKVIIPHPNAKIILPDSIVENKALLFDEKIVGIVTEADIPSDVDVIDAKGCYVAPGLVDVHIH